MAVTTAEQSGRRVAITITGLPVLPAAGQPHPATPWTLYRTDGSKETVVRGAVARPLTASSSTVVIDRETPLGRPFMYVLRYRATSGPVSVASAWMTVNVGARAVLSDPVGEAQVDVTIDDWPSRTREARGSAFDVDGRAASIYIVSARMGGSSSAILLRTDTPADAVAVERLVETGRAVLLRAPVSGVPDAYLWVESYQVIRRSKSAADVHRYHQLGVLEVEMPEPSVAASGDTLTDLAAAVPTTLQALSQTFPTLLSIASADLGRS